MRDYIVFILAGLFALFLAFIFDETMQQAVFQKAELFAYAYLGMYALCLAAAAVTVLVRKYRQSGNPKKASNLKIMAVTGCVLLGLYFAVLWIL
ncbi:MAG: hypothetical protein IKQ91_07045 [Oscillospiraceae bacterium]|nr:hypothetical protein [Oscillospiraceae bacterium]